MIQQFLAAVEAQLHQRGKIARDDAPLLDQHHGIVGVLKQASECCLALIERQEQLLHFARHAVESMRSRTRLRRPDFRHAHVVFTQLEFGRRHRQSLQGREVGTQHIPDAEHQQDQQKDGRWRLYQDTTPQLVHQRGGIGAHRQVTVGQALGNDGNRDFMGFKIQKYGKPPRRVQLDGIGIRCRQHVLLESPG